MPGKSEMNALMILSTVLQLIPAIIAAIKAIEEVIPGEGKGELKLRAIREIIEGVYDKAAAIWPAIEKTIGILVGVFNTVGVFKKGK
jgi:phage-related protein